MENRCKFIEMAAPRFVNLSGMLIAGIAARYNMAKIEGVDQHWSRFAERVGFVPERVGSAYYGVYRNFDGSGFEYITGVEVSGHSVAPEDFVTVPIKDHFYAVFEHHGSAVDMGDSHYTIRHKWLPESGYDLGDGTVFEKYDHRFDPNTGTGVVEIWLPIKE